MQHMRELLLPFAASSCARTSLISADEAAMVDAATRSLATRIWAAAAEKRARARGEARCLRRLRARPFTARLRGGRARGRARAAAGHGERDLRGRMRALWGSPLQVLCDIGGRVPAALRGL